MARSIAAWDDSELAGVVQRREPLRRLADRIVELDATGADDVLVLVARYHGVRS